MRIADLERQLGQAALPRLLPWLDERQPDVVCLQETKLADDAFAELLGDELAERGYEVAAHGEAAWNGVAILSRAGLEDVVARPRRRARASRTPRRARSRRPAAGSASSRSTCPNGRAPGSDHYEYKLAWLAALRDVVARRPRRDRRLRRHEHRARPTTTSSTPTPTSARRT